MTCLPNSEVRTLIDGYDAFDYEGTCWNLDCNNCQITCGCSGCHGQALYDATSPEYSPYDYHPYYDDSERKADEVVGHYCNRCIIEGNIMMTEDFLTPEFERAAITLQRIWRARQYYLITYCDSTSCDCCDSTCAWIVIQRGGSAGDGEIYNLCDDCYDCDEQIFRGQLVFDYE